MVTIGQHKYNMVDVKHWAILGLIDAWGLKSGGGEGYNGLTARLYNATAASRTKSSDRLLCLLGVFVGFFLVSHHACMLT